MGKGRIIEVDGEGLYQVELVHDMEPIQAMHDKLIESRSQLLEPLANAKHEADLARADAVTARAELNNAIINDDKEWMQEAATEAQRASSVEYATAANYAVLDAEYTAKNREIWTLESALTQRDPVIACWCADYTVDLDTGTEVGTIEIPDEYNPSRPVIIQPAWRPDDPKIGAIWDCARDGFLMRADAQGPYQAYYNAVMLPGLQKYKPFYRVADLLQVDGDTASIIIDREYSSASRSAAYKRFTTDAFPINPPGADTSDNALSFEAPITYMDCNGAAFQAGDRVAVYFGGDWTTPMVIGFESNPRACLLTGFLCLPAADGGFHNGWREPFTEENIPLGTVMGDYDPPNISEHRRTIVTPAGFFLRGGDDAYQAQYPLSGAGPNSGNCNWFGEALSGGRLTWYKPGGKYFVDVYDEYNGGFSFATSYLPGQIIQYDWGGLKGWAPTEVRTINSDGSAIIGKDDMNRSIYFNGKIAAGITVDLGSRMNGCGVIEHNYIDDEGEPAVVTWLVYVTYLMPADGGPPTSDVFRAVRVMVDGGVLVYDGVIVNLGSVDYEDLDYPWLPLYGNWSFSQSGRMAAAIRNDEAAEPTIGFNLLFEVEFSADETTVLMTGPTITPQPNGFTNWTRAFGDNGAAQYQGDSTLREVIAADYQDNRLVLASLESTVSETVNVTSSVQVGGFAAYEGYLTDGTHTISTDTGLFIDGLRVDTINDTLNSYTYTYTYNDDTGVSYSCSRSQAISSIEHQLMAIDIRNGFFAYSQIDDRSTEPQEYSGSGASVLSVSWSGTEGTIFDGRFSDHYPPLGQVWSGITTLDQSGQVSGTNDPLDSRNSTGIDITFIVLLADPGIDSGTFENFGVSYTTDFYRPNPVVTSKTGEIIALSSANGFGRPTWYFGTVDRSVTNWPSSFVGDAGLSGKENPRLCPLNLL